MRNSKIIDMAVKEEIEVKVDNSQTSEKVSESTLLNELSRELKDYINRDKTYSSGFRKGILIGLSVAVGLQLVSSIVLVMLNQ